MILLKSCKLKIKLNFELVTLHSLHREVVLLINTGEYNNMAVVRKSASGYYLSKPDADDKSEIFMSNINAMEEELKPKSNIEVFVYRDSEDKLTATLIKPLAKVGDIAFLKVVSNTSIGAFVDIGLDRDVLVPRKEQVHKLEVGRKYLFYIYLDKTGRLAASADIDKRLENKEVFRIGDEVTGIVYGFQPNGSAMVAIGNKYRGVILKNEYYTDLKPGDELNLRIKKFYEDGKMALTPRKVPKDERLALEDVILKYLKAHDGYMPYNDKSSPDRIRDTFHESKNYFKNALGGLMKQGLIEQDENGTRLK